METRKIIRSNGSGVWFGEIKERDGDRFTLTNARRLWYWEGAASLSELAMKGTASPSSCKFPIAVDEVEVFNVLEVLTVSDEAAKSIDEVWIWGLKK